MGQSPRKTNLFSRGYKLKDDNVAGGKGSETARSERSMRVSMASGEETNPLSFEGQAHKGAMTAVAGFSNMFEDETDDMAETRARQEDTQRRSSKANRVEPVLSGVLSGGEDGFVRKISTGRGAGKVTITFKGHSKVGSVVQCPCLYVSRGATRWAGEQRCISHALT